MTGPRTAHPALTVAGLIALIVGVGFPATCHAFFFFAWSGKLNHEPASLVQPGTDQSANPPSARSPTVSEENPNIPPGIKIPPNEVIPLVPEPTTILVAGIGLVVVVAARVGMRYRSDHSPP
ncbi:MAG: PEP-CTERM sorting domain-containing protein [Bacteroidales bacterium]|nr:PEP-CTERM sorting domain-containing protein [Bacteroidales bacterium]